MKKFWGKNMKYWFMGEKYEDLLRKNENLRGKRWKKRWERGNFHYTWGKYINLEKGGRISIFKIIYTPGSGSISVSGSGRPK